MFAAFVLPIVFAILLSAAYAVSARYSAAFAAAQIPPPPPHTVSHSKVSGER
jgi:hypothetical protein